MFHNFIYKCKEDFFVNSLRLISIFFLMSYFIPLNKIFHVLLFSVLIIFSALIIISIIFLLLVITSGILPYSISFFLFTKLITKKNNFYFFFKYNVIQNISIILSFIISNLILITFLPSPYGFLFSFLNLLSLLYIPLLYIPYSLKNKGDLTLDIIMLSSIIKNISLSLNDIKKSFADRKVVYNKKMALKDALLLKILIRNPYLKNNRYAELFENYQIKELMKIVKQKENDKKLILKKQLEENDLIANEIWVK